MSRQPTKQAKPTEPIPAVREPSEAETEAIKAAARSYLQRPARASLSLKANPIEGVTISNPHADGKGWNVHLSDTFGTSSDAFSNQSLARVLTAVADGRKPVTETQANAAVALMGAVAPTNELEAAIGEQIIATHTASLDFLNRARVNAGEYRDTAVAYTNAATKLTRSMALLVETLARLRSGGRQRIEVIYVNGPAVLGQNAQAIITGGEGAAGGKLGQSHALDVLAAAPAAAVAPMRRADPPGDALPRTSGPRPAPLPDARRHKPRRSDG